MEEVFDQRDLLSRDSLRVLQIRHNAASTTRLAVHLSALLILAYLVTVVAHIPILGLLASAALAFVWATIFAPFHECTHRTAFTSRRANAIGAWLSGIPFAMAPGFYRAFHFEHHRHTQEPNRDPEIPGDPEIYAVWPKSFAGWLKLISGYGLFLLKAVPLVRLSVVPTNRWDAIAPWLPPQAERARIAWECRIVLEAWIIFLLSAATIIDGGWWLIFAAWFAHVIQTLWITAEHTGLPLSGTILERTRTMQTHRFISWWLWNMNFHAEHHAWPGIPWHQLPAAHAQIQDQLAHKVDGYVKLHRDVLAAMK